MTEQRKKLGKWGEEKAKEFLAKKGYKPIAQNWRNRYGEIDLIMKDKETIVFVEVRTKSSNLFGRGDESITNKKQQQLIKMAKSFLSANNYGDYSIRFDLISIDKVDQNYHITHLENVLF